MLSALETAHAAGIVHRDIEPSNIMVLPGDRVKLTDFGIARANDDPSLTKTGGVMGSPGYMAPELFVDSGPTPASDLWALGATLFHVVEGRAPFTRESTAQTMHAVLYEQPVLERCTEPLGSVIMGLLDHSTHDRLTGPAMRSLLGEPLETIVVPAPPSAVEITQQMAPIDERNRKAEQKALPASRCRPHAPK